ncbi:MAG TPA: hypothetical protein VF556_15655 [Pyrinomonadaceae bacterium]|jgi:hypothetical protein
MNVFEDLIGALKEEDLLEETVIKTGKNKENEMFPNSSGTESKKADAFADFSFVEKLSDHPSGTLVQPQVLAADEFEEITSLADFSSAKKSEVKVMPEAEAPFKTNVRETKAKPPETIFQENAPVVDEKEFYRKRAMEEVSGLQMVEHVLSGVEREQSKTVAQVYDDIAVKKALHDFLQVSENVKSSEHAQAEFRLMQETENWCSALSHRDKKITVAQLRRFCETTKPPLSSQALISLARFYRNLPFSEPVRGKFDLIATRLFAKDIGGEKRVMVFTREELIEHLGELYAEWSSVPLYLTGENETKIAETAVKLEEFMAEAEGAESFDELVNNDFFNRLRFFKESTDEMFFAPLITATIIESNIRIGNRFVDLIEIERDKSGIVNFEEKYGFINEQLISDSTSKTLQLVELLKEKNKQSKTPPPSVPAKKPLPEKSSPAIANAAKTEAKPNSAAARKTKTDKAKIEKTKVKAANELFAVNKWLLTATVLIVLASFGLYFWSDYGAAETSASAKVKKVNLENSSLKEYLQTARINENTFYGVTSPSWDALSLEKKEELLKKIFSSGKDKGYVKVQLLNMEGKAVGYATPEKTEVVTK